MANIVPRKRGSGEAVPVTRHQAREFKEIVGASAVERARIAEVERISTDSARAANRVGVRAMEAHSVTCATQKMIVEMEPSAIHGCAFLAQKLLIGLGRIMDNTIDELT